jgi:hypothetical protein
MGSANHRRSAFGDAIFVILFCVVMMLMDDELGVED